MSPEDGVNDDSDSPRGVRDDSSFRQELDELASTYSGINVVYSVLDLLKKCYGLDDVVVVLTDESFGAQFFRLGGKAVSAELAARLGSGRAIYCNPDAVPQRQREEALNVCQRAFSEQSLRFNAAHGAYGDLERPLESSSGAATIATRSRRWLASRVEPVLRVDYRELLTSWPAPDSRMVVSRALVFTDVLLFALTVGGVHGPLRFVLGLVLGLVIPGWSAVGLIGLRNPALEFGLSLAASLSLVMVAAQVMITLHLWHPVTLEEMTCVVCLPSLLWQARHTRSAEET